MDNELDSYLTITKRCRTEIKVKSSKFISTIIPVKNKDEAMQEIGTIKTEFYNANHNCYAYKIGPDGLEFRYSDDGEPNGSAGKPILFAINKYNLTNILVVVTRFFGGTKLGVGGLARAYTQSTETSLNICQIEKMYKTKNLKVFCSYEDLNIVKYLLQQLAISYVETFQDAIEIDANIPISMIDRFILDLKNKTGDRAGCILE